ncbi:response regulator [Brevundimonas vitis]|mgnify:CR=1 FL=1|uniref:Response regulator n=1 Tax=Brevundimonas vitisensis TaxID=2800818 RepID=A0ABX7BKK9_9CAUL|nr:response regulator [Brevundimonas vitisensis]QQQ18095.1 response regulator [Brevundimonas vitisensis]
MEADPHIDGSARLDFREARVLCADANSQGLDILGQMLIGFGIQHITRVQTAEEFKDCLSRTKFDLILLEGGLNGNGYELVTWLRRSRLEPNRYAPVVMIAGHPPRTQVEQARDCGASFVVVKPISATTLLARIMWVGRSGRLFVEADNFVGPDRRFKNEGVPAGQTGRRRSDLSGEVGEAVDPNMSQSEIDSLLKPQKMSL